MAAFFRAFAQARGQRDERTRQQQQEGRAQQQIDLQTRAQQSQEDYRQQDLMLRAETQRQAEVQRRLQYTQGLHELFLDPEVDPDLALAMATDPNRVPEGYDVGAVRALHGKVFTPTERQRRVAVRKLKEIETTPDIRKRLEAGEDLGNITFKIGDLGPNPQNPEGRPLWTRTELQQLAQRPTPVAPLPPTRPVDRALQSKDITVGGKPAVANFDPTTGQYFAPGGQTPLENVGIYERPPDPTLQAIRENTLAQKRIATLTPIAQRRVNQLADAFRNDPTVKRTNIQAEATAFVDSLDPNSQNPADDQAIIYAFAKAMDPDSVVREGEYAVVQKYAQAWQDNFKFNAIRVLENREFLTPLARANMKATIKKRYLAGRQQYDNIRRQFAKQINQATGERDGDEYLIDYAAAFPSAGQPPATPAAPRGATSNPFRR